MLSSVSNYLYERRARFVRSAGVAGGLYLVGQYAKARIEDMKDGVLEQRAAREKYVLVGLSSPIFPSSLILPLVYANDSSRIRKISRLRP
jgi:Peroxin-3